jgi:hypothetical protein
VGQRLPFYPYIITPNGTGDAQIGCACSSHRRQEGTHTKICSGRKKGKEESEELIEDGKIKLRLEK